MARSVVKRLGLLLPLVTGGCLGLDKVGTFTSDNIGINVQSTPAPAVELSFSRQEGALEPAFEDGNTPSAAASLQHTASGGITKFSDDTKAIFAGGNAAIFAAGEDPGASGIDAVACITKPPNRAGAINTVGQTSPLIFGTDTIFGLKVSFAVGLAAPQMASGNLGYKRYELAIAPVFGREHGCSHSALLAQAEASFEKAQADTSAANEAVKKDKDAVKNSTGVANTQAQAKLTEDTALAYDKARMRDVAEKRFNAIYNAKEGDPNYDLYALYIPSTLAVANDDVGAAAAGNGANFTVAQVFATGRAAEVIAKKGVSGGITSVAASVAKPADGVVPGPVFDVSGTITSGAKAWIAPGIAINGYDATALQLAGTYTAASGDTIDKVAAGLAKGINDYRIYQLMGVGAKATNAQVTLTIPSNLSFINNTLNWTGSKAGTGTIAVTKETSGS